MRQGWAFEHARPHRREKRARPRRLGLLDEHVEALFDGEPGADQCGELARDQRQTLARQPGAREALAPPGLHRRRAYALDGERREAAFAQQRSRVALGVRLDHSARFAAGRLQRAVLEARHARCGCLLAPYSRLILEIRAALPRGSARPRPGRGAGARGGRGAPGTGWFPLRRSRTTAPAASLVCRVASTRCPVRLACTAICAVSRSRISPIMTTSGSWRRMARSARAKVSSIRGFTWVWPTPSRSYSIGSSTVTMLVRLASSWPSAA